MPQEQTLEKLKMTLPAILNIPDICSVLKVSPTTVRRELARKNGLPGYLADGEWSVNRADFLVYLEQNGTL